MNQLKHIGIIPDGNRRYAKKHILDFEKAYQKGIENFMSSIKFLSKIENLEIVTVYGMSIDNYQKRIDERQIIFRLIEEMLKRALETREFDKYKTKIKFIGEREMFPKEMLEKIKKIEKETEENRNLTLNIALAYSGKKEIEQAARKAMPDITEETIRKNLYVPENLDLIIRTGGFHRISDFLIMQSAYSELYFTDKLWPELNSEEIQKAIDFYNSTKRNFGQ